MVVNELIYVAIVPLAVAAAVAFVARRLRFPPRVVWAAGVALGYVAGQLGLKGRNGIERAISSLVRPHEAVDWLPLATLLALGVTIFATYAPRAWQRWSVVLAAALSIGLPLRLLAGSAYVTQHWSLLEKLSYIALLSATFGLTWLLLAAARDDEQPRLRPVLLIIVATGAALVIALSGVFVYGELCGIVAAALTGTAIVVFSAPNGISGAAGVLTFSLGSLIVLAAFYAKLAPANAAMLFISLMLAGGRFPEFVSSRPAWQQTALRAGLCLLPLAVALASSIAAAQADMTPDPYAI